MKFYSVQIDEKLPVKERKQIIKKYTDNYQGFVAEEYLAFLCGMVDEEPKRLVIKVNGITEPKYILEDDVTLKPSKLQITKDNYSLLKVVELISGVGKIDYDCPDPVKAITQVIKDEKVNPLKMLSVVKKHFGQDKK